MKKIYLLAALWLLTSPLHAQTLNFQWQLSLGDSLYDEGKQVITDAQGNVYSTGYFKGLVDFDPSSTVFTMSSNSDIAFYVTKFSSQGQFIWAKQFVGTTQSEGNNIALDANGNVFLAGSFSNLTDLDPGSGTYYLSAQGTDAFVLKLDPMGNFVWAKNFGGGYGEMAFDIKVAADGHIYFTGEFYDVADFDPNVGVFNLSSPNSASIFVCKLHSDGSLVWAKQLSGSTSGAMFNRGLALEIDQNQNVYCTGYFSGIGDFDPNSGVQNLTSAGSQDIFISKLDSAGNYVWSKRIGGTSTDVAYDMVYDASGYLYLGGSYASTVDFNPGSGVNNLISGTNSSAFICKLDVAGNFVWAIPFSGSGSSCINWGLAIDPQKNVYTTGFFYNSIDFDPSWNSNILTAPSTETESYISKVDSSGNLVWVLPLTGSGGTTGRCVHYANDGSLYVTGYFSGFVDFDPGPATNLINGNTNHDAYILKLSSSTPTMLNNLSEENSTSILPNPCSTQFNLISSGTPSDLILYDIQGRVVQRFQETQGPYQLNALNSGVYILRYQLNHKTYSSRLVIP